MMAYAYLTQLFTDGMNKDYDPGALDLTMQNQTISVVSDSANMVFERGLAHTRLGLAPVPGPPAPLPSTANLRVVRMIPVGPRSVAGVSLTRGGFAITDAPKLYSLQALATSFALNPFEITGPGFTGFSGWYNDSALVNGVVMIAGNGTGLIRWDPAAAVYTVVANSPYQYVTGHLSRAVAAYDLSLAPTGYAQTVAWSKPGDETVWTGATNGSGKTILADVEDSITGIKVAKGTIVLARTYGFHLGIPTGQFPAVYDWRKISSNSIGVMHPASLVVYKDILFFMSECGIHMFDLVDITDIGEGIHQEILALIRQSNVVVRGFISPGYDPDFQPSYNLCLDTERQFNFIPGVGPAAEVNFPHYSFNLREKKWSRHFYVDQTHTTPTWSPLIFNAEFIPNFSNADPPSQSFVAVYQRVAGASPTLLQWTANVNLDTPAYLTTCQFTMADPTQDVQMERILMTYNCPPTGGGIVVTATLSFTLNGVTNSVATTITTYPAAGWDRRWFNLRAVGNMMSLTLSFPIGTPSNFQLKSLMFEYTSVAKVRT